MIQTETITINDASFVRTFSDANKFVVRDGYSYCEAVDPIEFANDRTYTEGALIPTEEPTDAEYAEAGRILLGAQSWQA